MEKMRVRQISRYLSFIRGVLAEDRLVAVGKRACRRSLGIKKVSSGRSKGITESRSLGIGDYTGKDLASSAVGTAMFADDGNDDSSEWKAYSSKKYGRNITSYGESGTMKHMPNKRRAMYGHKPCKDSSVSTTSNQLFSIIGIAKLRLAFLHENPTGLILDEVLHVP